MVKWGVIGPGSIANSFATELAESGLGQLVGVYGRNKDKAKVFAEKYNAKNYYSDINEFLNNKDIEAVYIATFHNSHMEYAEKCIMANKHVLCEKPFSYNEATAEKVINMAKEKNLFIMEAMWTLYLPAINQALQWINEGKIGKVKLIEVDFGFKCNENKLTRINDPLLAGGALLDVGVYTISFANYMAQSKIREISGKAIMTKTGVDDTDIISIKYENGIIASIICSIGNNTKHEGIIYGEKGTIKIPQFWGAKKAYLDTNEENLVFEDSYEMSGYKYEIIEACNCIKNKKLQSNIVTTDFTLEVARAMDEIKRQIGLVYPFE